MIQCIVCQNNAIICQQAHRLITQWHKFPLTTPHLHTMGSLSFSLPLPLLTPTQRRKDGVKRDTVIRGIAYLFLPVLPASLPYLNTQLDPCLYFSLFFSFYFCSLPWLPGKDSLCCLSSHLLLATVDICLFKLSPILSGLSPISHTFILFHCLYFSSLSFSFFSASSEFFCWPIHSTTVS